MLLGFDIGGTKCAVLMGRAVAGKAIEVLRREELPTRGRPGEMIEEIFSMAEGMLANAGIGGDGLQGIGISCGGPLNSRTGVIVAPPNLLGWINIPIVEMVERRFGCRAFLQNDANACAVAEWKYGAGRGYQNLIFLTAGTGMGAGLILDGRLYSGTSDLAGEVGHWRLADLGPVGFGKSGSFEGFCSGGGIAQLGQSMAREKLQVGESVSYCADAASLGGITARDIAVQASGGDVLAKEVFRYSGHYLGRALSLLIDVLNPEIIILGSIYGRAKELLDASMYEVLRREALAISLGDCVICPAGLGEAVGDIAALSLAEMAAER